MDTLLTLLLSVLGSQRPTDYRETRTRQLTAVSYNASLSAYTAIHRPLRWTL